MASSYTTFLISFFITTILSSNINTILIKAQKQSPKPKAFHIPIKKDPKTHQYLAIFNLGTPPAQTTAAVDLAGSYLALSCDNRHVSPSRRQLQCGSAECQAVANKCSGRANDASKCVVSTPNPFNDKNKPLSYGTLNDDGVTVNSTEDGASYWSRITYVCVDGEPKSLSTAVLGLGTEPYSLPKKLSSDYNLPPKFALCLPATSNAAGSLFVGGGGYAVPDDASRWLSYTPLSGGHVISARSVRVDKALVKLGQPNPAVKISTSTYHGVLESSVYEAVVGGLSRRNLTRVGSAEPYSACYSAVGVRWTRAGARVPVIEIELEGNMVAVNWRIYGGNSMVRVSEKVMCLGFVDGGKNMGKDLIVLGGLQIENNLLEFDLTASRLGFSSSLLPRGLSCSTN